MWYRSWIIWNHFLFFCRHKRKTKDFLLARYRETQMKTSHFSENFDLCHPQLGRSEHSNNNLTTNSNFTSDIASKHDLIGASFGTSSSTTVNYPTSSTSTALSATYGSTSSDHQPSKYEKNANELLIKTQQRQQQQQQEQNKKRKRETGEFLIARTIKFSRRCRRLSWAFSSPFSPSSSPDKKGNVQHAASMFSI